MSEWFKEIVSKTIGSQEPRRFESYRLRFIIKLGAKLEILLHKIMKREFSSGGIVFNNRGQVLIIQHSTNHHWGFPKGHIEKGQTTKEAALREVKEEGGIEAEIIEKVGDSKYVYMLNGEKIFKVVTIFLMRYVSGDIKDHDWEVSETKWLSPEEAMETLSFSQDKILLKKALEVYKTLS